MQCMGHEVVPFEGMCHVVGLHLFAFKTHMALVCGNNAYY
jgi:hypothetical protein